MSQGNDKIFISFIEIGVLVNDLLEQFVFKENMRIEKLSAVSGEIKKQLKTNFTWNLSPKTKIQRGEEETETEPEPIQFSNPLKKKKKYKKFMMNKKKIFYKRH